MGGPLRICVSKVPVQGLLGYLTQVWGCWCFALRHLDLPSCSNAEWGRVTPVAGRAEIDAARWC